MRPVAVRQRIAVAIVSVVIGVTLLAQVALADATPVQLILMYMPNVSNTGSSAASGIAELVMPEGEFRINTADLRRLDGDKQYVAWVINTSTNEFQRLGAFNTAESTGSLHYENVLPDAIPNKHWNLLIITVEDSPTPARPSSRHSIAGVFPGPDNAPLPGVLPNTGGDELSAVSYQLSAVNRAEWLAASVLAALTLTVTFGSGYVVARRRAPRQ